MSGRLQEQLSLGGDLGRPWPFGDLQAGHYRTIIADPPWSFHNWSAAGEKKNANQHYACMSLVDIRALPVSELARPDGCGLLMWATSPLLDEAVDTLKAWGFDFKGCGSWGKLSSTGKARAFGPGYIFRVSCEFYLVGMRGKLKRQSASVRNFIEAPVREHSRKPDQIFEDAKKLWPGPYLELFSRQSRPGWDAWGLETGKFNPTETEEGEI